MKKLLILIVCLWAFGSAPGLAQSAPADVVLVRFSRSGAGSGTLLIAVTRADGKTELSRVSANFSDKGVVAASEAEYKVLQQLYAEGYKLVSSGQEYNYTTFWVFSK